MTKTATLIFSICFILLGLATTTQAHNPTHGGEVDIKASTITWLGKKVVGEDSGAITLKAGGLKFVDHTLVGGHFIIDMSTITCTDLQGKSADKLVGHLHSADFFQTADHGTSEFIMTSAVNQGENNYSITGNLTIKGITNPITFDATVTEKSASAVINVDRTAYDIKYGSGSFFDNLGDKAIDNNFQMTINLVLK